MKILALDTSTAACSLALLSDEQTLLHHELMPKLHAQSILPLLEALTQGDLTSIDALAWGCGPGSFTGLRIASSVIQALGFALDLPIINVSSLAAIAQTAYNEEGWKQLLVAMDARMQEVYWARYSINSEGYAELIGKEQVCPPEEVETELAELASAGVAAEGRGCGSPVAWATPALASSPVWYGVGDAWSIYENELNNRIQYVPKALAPACLPKALAIAQLGRIKFAKGEGCKPAAALPVYLRDKVVS